MTLQSITTGAHSAPHTEVPCGLVWTFCLFAYFCKGLGKRVKGRKKENGDKH